MEPFTTHTGLVAPLPKRDVDTDQIIPKQFLKRLGRTGFDDALFFDWRADGHGRRQPDFVLNDARYTGASVLLAGANFGCGSSREHAVWALHDYGFRVVLAPSFADIFASNAVANGLLTGRIADTLLDTLVGRAGTIPGYTVTVDLQTMMVRDASGLEAPFSIDARARQRLLEGLDDIALILRHDDAIGRYEAAHPR